MRFETIERVVDKFIDELRGQLREKKVEVEMTEEARAQLATLGFDPLFGARPMARVIQAKIKEPLASELLFGVLQGGGVVRIEKVDSDIALKYEPVEANGL